MSAQVIKLRDSEKPVKRSSPKPTKSGKKRINTAKVHSDNIKKRKLKNKAIANKTNKKYRSSREMVNQALEMVDHSPSRIMIELAKIKKKKGLFKPLTRGKPQNGFFSRKEINVVAAVAEGAALNDIAMYYDYDLKECRQIAKSEKAQAFLDFRKEAAIDQLANLREKAYDGLAYFMTDKNAPPAYKLKSIEMWLSIHGEFKEPEVNVNTKQQLLEMLTQSKEKPMKDITPKKETLTIENK